MAGQARFQLSANAQQLLDDMAGRTIENYFLPRVADAAKRIVPVDTGDLQASIKPVTEGNAYYVVADSEYALHVEEGTSKMAAQPYLRPAISTRIN